MVRKPGKTKHEVTATGKVTKNWFTAASTDKEENREDDYADAATGTVTPPVVPAGAPTTPKDNTIADGSA